MSRWTSPQLGGLPHLRLSRGENSPQVSGLPSPADRTTLLGGVPHLLCERDQEKREIVCRGWLPHRDGAPHASRGPPPPCKQARNETYIECLNHVPLANKTINKNT